MASARTSSGWSSTTRILVAPAGCSRPTPPGRSRAGPGCAGTDPRSARTSALSPGSAGPEPGACAAVTGSAAGLPGQLIERDVQVEHVDPGLAEEAERAALGVPGHQVLDRRDRQVPGRSHAV